MADNNKTNFSSLEYPKPQEKPEKEKDLPKKIGDKMKEEAGEEKEKINTGDETIGEMVKGGADFIKPKDQEEIGAERKKIVNKAGEEVKGFEGDAEEVITEKPEEKTFFDKDAFEKNIPKQLKSLREEAEAVKSSDAGLQNKYKSVNEIFGKMAEIAKNCSQEYYKGHHSEFSEIGEFLSEIKNDLEYKLIGEFNSGFKLYKEKALAVKDSSKSYTEKIEYIQNLINLLYMKETDSENLDIFSRHYGGLKTPLEETKKFLEKTLAEIKEEEIKSKGEGEPLTEEEKTTLTEKEQLTIDNIEKILEEEQEFIKQYEGKGSSVARIYGPAIEAIRSLCNNDKEVSIYMNLLIEKIKQKLESGEVEYMGEAVEKTYKELDGDKKRAFEKASKNEVKRQQNKPRDGMGITVETPPERLFREFAMKLLEKMPLEKKSKEQQVQPEGKETPLEESNKKETAEDEEIENIIKKVESEGKISPEEGEFILKKIQEKESEFYKETSKEEREKLGKEFLKYEELDDEEKKRRESEIEEAKKKFAEDEKVAVENEEEIERKISELEKELKEKFENYAKMDEEFRAIYESEDTAGRKELGPVSDQLKEVWKYELKLEKLDYLRQSLTDKKSGSIEEQIKDPEALLNSCDRRKSGIEHWEKNIAMLDKDFEEMSEEEKSFFEKLLVWVKHNPKKAVLIATLIAAGVLVAPYAAPYITAENVGKVAIAGAGAAALKKLRPQMKRLAEIGGTAAIVGLLLLNDNWGSIDDFAEWACGAKIPNWAKRLEDKSKK